MPKSMCLLYLFGAYVFVYVVSAAARCPPTHNAHAVTATCRADAITHKGVPLQCVFTSHTDAHTTPDTRHTTHDTTRDTHTHTHTHTTRHIKAIARSRTPTRLHSCAFKSIPVQHTHTLPETRACPIARIPTAPPSCCSPHSASQCLATSWQLEDSAGSSGVLQMVRSSLLLGAAFCVFGPLLVFTPERKIYVKRKCTLEQSQAHTNTKKDIQRAKEEAGRRSGDGPAKGQRAREVRRGMETCACLVCRVCMCVTRLLLSIIFLTTSFVSSVLLTPHPPFHPSRQGHRAACAQKGDALHGVYNLLPRLGCAACGHLLHVARAQLRLWAAHCRCDWLLRVLLLHRPLLPLCLWQDDAEAAGQGPRPRPARLHPVRRCVVSVVLTGGHTRGHHHSTSRAPKPPPPSCPARTWTGSRRALFSPSTSFCLP